MTNKELQEKLNHVIKYTFNSLFGAKIIVDENGIILYASPYHFEYLGYTEPEEIIGKYVEDVIPGTRMHIILKTEEPEYGYIFNFIHKDTKEIVPVICNRAPIYDENNKLIGALSDCVYPVGVEQVLTLAEEVKKMDEHTSSSFKHRQEQLSDYIIGRSEQISHLRHLVGQCASFPLPVLITGETGCGKEVFANAIHRFGDRADLPYVKINCAAIPNELLESELFGYEPGAFSGALAKGKIGRLEYAGKGTVLLDEIGDMPMALQSKLLRAIQEKEFEKVGGLESTPFEARIICTTNRNIEELIERKKFRQDLYYRINAIELHIPPLRERKEDIELLVHYFIAKTNGENGLSVVGIDPDALALLCEYDWPGNVRELRHLIERACFVVGAGVLERKHFASVEKKIESKSGQQKEISEGDLDKIDFESLNEAKEYVETVEIKKALQKAHGNKSMAAKILKIDRSVLYEKIKKYGID